jgi:hypothetical protein
MKNIFSPASAPRASRSTSKGADPVAFDNHVDIPAALGASPVPDNTPTHPTLYKESLAFGSPRGSKLCRVHQFRSPNTTSDDNQKQLAKKEEAHLQARFDVHILDNIDNALNEDCNLHYHSDNKSNSKLPKQYEAPIIKNIKTSPVATTTNKATKMQTSTNFNTIDDKPTKLGTTIDLDAPNIIHYAPTNYIYKHLESTGDNEEVEETLLTLLCTTTRRTQHTPTLTILNNKTTRKRPQKLPFHPLRKSSSTGLTTPAAVAFLLHL